MYSPDIREKLKKGRGVIGDKIITTSQKEIEIFRGFLPGDKP